MSAPGTVVVLGAGGAIGSHVVDALVDQGRPVRAVTRRAVPARPGVDGAVADLMDAGQLRAAIDGAAVVVHAAQPAYTRWSQEFPALSDAVADAVAGTGARLLFADNLYSYGPVNVLSPRICPPRPQTTRAWCARSWRTTCSGGTPTASSTSRSAVSATTTGRVASCPRPGRHSSARRRRARRSRWSARPTIRTAGATCPTSVALSYCSRTPRRRRAGSGISRWLPR
ncbi:MAG: NAD-dependent epimerase/dehydratase family protein [Pseudonocardia sp.]|nr:NAD-dependent epimerase/dehydratase family protein [Pseudonocardia sp.]